MGKYRQVGGQVGTGVGGGDRWWVGRWAGG